MKYINTGVVFSEIPDEVTLCINISNCPCRCPGCHSKYLWADEGRELTPDALDSLIRAQRGNITCVCFMGGDRAPQEVEALALWVREAHPALRVGWYSGRTLLPRTIRPTHFDYIKLGPYLEHLGPLNNPHTNQRLYSVQADGRLHDITARFWRKQA